MPTPKPAVDYDDLTAQFGWTKAVLDALPEVKKVIDQWLGMNGTPDRLQAMIRGTKWYRTHSESERSGLLLKETDPREFARRMDAMRTHVRGMYTGMAGGRNLSDAYVNNFASQAMLLGWSDEQLKSTLARSINYSGMLKNDQLGGQAGQLQDFITRTAADYGIKVSGGYVTNMVKYAMQGVHDQDSIRGDLLKQAKIKYRGFSDDLDRGMTMNDIAEPYKQTYAQLLELNPNEVNLDDGLIQRALTRLDDKTGKPKPMAVWELQDQVRNDPRWMQTNNARDSIMAVGHKLLSDMGLST